MRGTRIAHAAFSAALALGAVADRAISETAKGSRLRLLVFYTVQGSDRAPSFDIATLQVERVLMRHPYVEDAGVVGAPGR